MRKTKTDWRASWTRSGDNYLPVIVCPDGKRRTVWGDPLPTRALALKYARLHLQDLRMRVELERTEKKSK
jgi:hypothetical protein